MEDLTNNIVITLSTTQDKLIITLDKTEIRLDTLGQTYEFTLENDYVSTYAVSNTRLLLSSHTTKYTLICQNKETGKISRTPVENNYVRLDASVLSVGDNDLYLYAYNEELDTSILSEPATLSLIYTLATDTTLPAKYNVELNQHIKDIYHKAAKAASSSSGSIPTFYAEKVREDEWDAYTSYWSITTDVEVPESYTEADPLMFNIVFSDDVKTIDTYLSFNGGDDVVITTQNYVGYVEDYKLQNRGNLFERGTVYTLLYDPKNGACAMKSMFAVDSYAADHMKVGYMDTFPYGWDGYPVLNTHIMDMHLDVEKDSDGKIYFTYAFNAFFNNKYNSLITTQVFTSHKKLVLLDGTYRFFFNKDFTVSQDVLNVLQSPSEYGRDGQIEIEIVMPYSEYDSATKAYVDKKCITIIRVDPVTNDLSYVAQVLGTSPQYALLCNVVCARKDLTFGDYFAFPIMDGYTGLTTSKLETELATVITPLFIRANSSKTIDGAGYEHYTVQYYTLNDFKWYDGGVSGNGIIKYCRNIIVNFDSKPSSSATGIILAIPKSTDTSQGYANFVAEPFPNTFTPHQLINDDCVMDCTLVWLKSDNAKTNVSTRATIMEYAAILHTIGLADPTVQRETDNLGLYTASTDAKNIIKALEAYALAAYDEYRKDKYFSDLPTDFMVATTATQTVDTSTAVLNADTVTDDTQRYYVTIENSKVAVNGTSKLVEGLSYATFSIWYERSNTTTQYYIHMWHDDATSTTYNYQISVGQSIIHNKE